MRKVASISGHPNYTAEELTTAKKIQLLRHSFLNPKYSGL